MFLIFPGRQVTPRFILSILNIHVNQIETCSMFRYKINFGFWMLNVGLSEHS